MTLRRAVVGACAAVVLVLSGCAADAPRAGHDDAAAGANSIAFFLRNFVLQPNAAPAVQLAHVERWLAEPPPADLEQIGHPAFRVLSTDPANHVDIAVWAYGRTTAIEGKKGAWGHVCLRYAVDAASRLVTSAIACPSSLPERPD